MTPRRPAAAWLALLVALAVVAGCGRAPDSARPPKPVAVTEAPSTTPSPTLTATAEAYALQPLGTFSSPVWVGPAPGDPDHLYLVEKTGRVLRLGPDGQKQGVVLDLSDRISKGNEQGLLSIAFDPAFATNHRMYADWTDKDGNTQVVAYPVQDGVAGPGQVLLTVDQPYANHNGGLLLFDPTGMLLVGMGDGGSAGDPGNRAQDLSSDLGKILRIDPRTGLGAPGNPYRANPRVWALGLRNPWRFSFDTNGDLYLGDVGQSTTEELDVVPRAYQRGANYGWSVYEGELRFKPDQQFTPGGPLITPAWTYAHSTGGCSITGGEVYHGTALPALEGSYVFGDYCAGKLLETTRTATGVAQPLSMGVRVDG
ncbi:MAG: PQQ-dependent sugar dehydrogenase, partial [Mycobacteriales bacterium]